MKLLVVVVILTKVLAFSESSEIFGKLSHQIQRLEGKGLLEEMIEMRRDEIASIKTHWKEKISQFEDPDFLEELERLLKEGSLTPSEKGCGSAYFLFDSEGHPRYVIKPFDEDILCLNNRKQFASPYNNLAFRARDAIPLYRCAQAEALSYAVASLLHLSHLTPSTHLAVVSHPQFFDIGDFLEQETKIDREKFCSIQTYLSDIENLSTLVEEWLEKDTSEEEILSAIDQEDFENLILLIWLFYDNDAHAGNLYAKKDAKGVYHLLKIDNGLTFPNKNSHLVNALHFLPHANNPLSEKACHLIQNLPLEAITEKIALFEMEEALDAFYERVDALKKLTQEKKYPIRELDFKLKALEL